MQTRDHVNFDGIEGKLNQAKKNETEKSNLTRTRTLSDMQQQEDAVQTATKKVHGSVNWTHLTSQLSSAQHMTGKHSTIQHNTARRRNTEAALTAEASQMCEDGIGGECMVVR